MSGTFARQISRLSMQIIRDLLAYMILIIRPPLDQDHLKLDSDMIASLIISMVTLEPEVSVASIIERMNTQFNFSVSYKKAWLAKHKAIYKARNVIRCRCSSKDHLRLPPPQILEVLKNTRFYGVSRLHYFEFDNALVSALVERWRPETHIFYMTQGGRVSTYTTTQGKRGKKKMKVRMNGREGTDSKPLQRRVKIN
ncbi:serine/threonine-protein phosphatase 7 long form-like protein [Senna tora]|uniref:Serine/threonine-protein phosphatase 7 long form-like protein n=1 Tax=Senna tora TaxID=362788 RepID=A0A835CA39_9FABA|nr:serine/threonine-protein phosphatase 7 long form-like protein [Senna tora]